MRRFKKIDLPRVALSPEGATTNLRSPLLPTLFSPSGKRPFFASLTGDDTPFASFLSGSRRGCD